MYPLAQQNSRLATAQILHWREAKNLIASPLAAEEEAEVLDFLGERPIHTFGMAGFIHDNGLVSPHNRGTFYSCRSQNGRLEGVALVGHFILFETQSEAAIKSFARVAHRYPNVHMLLGEQGKVESFWKHYQPRGQAARHFCRELLLTLQWPVEAREAVPGLRLAVPADLDLIVPSHARTVVEESGINPLETDRSGFLQRCQRRIEQGHTWVLTENGKLIFKAEIVTDTSNVIYLEGVEVNPEERGKGHGLRCISQLTRTLLQRTASICLLANQRNIGAQSFYRKAGFKQMSYYDTIFLKENPEIVQ
ncbi:MAG: GNAT family N-acetyltransferase [Blastocatellia bacterium]